MSVDGLLVGRDGPVLRLTLDRPSRKNALTEIGAGALRGAREVDAPGRFRGSFDRL
jgi:hypothetical protein